MPTWDLMVDGVVEEKTRWGLTTTYRIVSTEPRLELKLTLYNEDVDLPLEEGDGVVFSMLCEGEEE
jgi:hypothetical protein